MYTPIQRFPGVAADLLETAAWRKSSYSGTHGNCVEVARNLPGVVAVRDSKNPDGPSLLVSPAVWLYFVSRLKVATGGREAFLRHAPQPSSVNAPEDAARRQALAYQPLRDLAMPPIGVPESSTGLVDQGPEGIA